MFRVTYTGNSQGNPRAGMRVPPHRTWAPGLAKALRRAGITPCRLIGEAINGETTPQQLVRLDVLRLGGDGPNPRGVTPDLAIWQGGENDPGAPLASSVTQQSIEVAFMAIKHGATGPGVGVGKGLSVADVASLPANGRAGQRYVVASTAAGNAGVPAWAPDHTPNVAAGTIVAGSVTVWEYRYAQAGANGWGCVAIPTTAPSARTEDGRVPFFVCLGIPYLNFVTGGDTLTTPYGPYAPFRAAQAAAIAAQTQGLAAGSGAFADEYALHKAEIQAGRIPDFAGGAAYDQTRSPTWTSGDQHKSALGHDLAIRAILAACAPKLAGWTS